MHRRFDYEPPRLNRNSFDRLEPMKSFLRCVAVLPLAMSAIVGLSMLMSACALRTAPIGHWEIAQGDLGLPYLSKGWWVNVAPGDGPEQVVVSWDDGLTCWHLPGKMSNSRIYVAEWNLEIAAVGLSGAKMTLLEDPRKVVKLKRHRRPFLGCE